MNLTAQQAIRTAKAWIAEQLASEQVEDIGLEEVKFEDGKWQITVGFSRPWDRRMLAAMVGGRLAARSYKVVVVSDEGSEVIEMRNREAA